MLRRWSAHQPGIAANARVISLQLGAGCSITATLGGIPLDTSMGFSPLEGLMMATRGGDLDPGLLLHMQRALSLEQYAGTLFGNVVRPLFHEVFVHPKVRGIPTDQSKIDAVQSEAMQMFKEKWSVEDEPEEPQLPIRLQRHPTPRKPFKKKPKPSY